jgi:AraC-like DNA-binding protein
MDPITDFATIKDYCRFNQQETRHPLIGLIDLSRADPRQLRRMRFGFYVVFLKEIHCGDLRYGCTTYDYDEGSLIFLAPGQVIGTNGTEYYQPQGHALVVHPDFLLGTALNRRMGEFSFFDYAASEALHLSGRERGLVQDCFNKVDYELDQLIDKHTKALLVSNMELLLNYCVRFYDRQFITRTHANRGVVARFEELLNAYYASEAVADYGLPTVGYFAERLHLSPNYLGDLIKRETGRSVQDQLQRKALALAKEALHDPSKTIAEVAYGLGFSHPQHFTRMFKRSVGMTPSEFRA